MNWEGSNYQSALKETERNISSIKYHLQKKRNPYTSPSKGLSVPSTMKFNYGTRFLSHEQSTNNVSSQNALLTSLMKRLDEQSKAIAHLSETVRTQSEDINHLKQYRNVDVSRGDNGDISFVERKIEHVRRELRSDIDGLQAQLRNSYRTQSNTDEGSLNYPNSISRDFSAQKRIIEDETDSIRREMDTLKTRIQKIESNLSTSLRDNQEVRRRCSTMEKNLSTLVDDNRRVYKKGDRRDVDLTRMKNELHDISNIINSLRREQKDRKKGKNSTDISTTSSISSGKRHGRNRNDKTKFACLENEEDSYITTLLSSDDNLSLDSFTMNDYIEPKGKQDISLLQFDNLLLEDLSEGDHILKTDDFLGDYGLEKDDLLKDDIFKDDLNDSDEDKDFLSENENEVSTSGDPFNDLKDDFCHSSDEEHEEEGDEFGTEDLHDDL